MRASRSRSSSIDVVEHHLGIIGGRGAREELVLLRCQREEV